MQRKAKKESLEDELKSLESEEAKLEEQIQELEKGREETEERADALKALSELEHRHTEAGKKLARFAEFDPEEMEKLKKNTSLARQAANRWVDNIFNCQSWAQNKFCMEKKVFSKQFGIPEELDYLED